MFSLPTFFWIALAASALLLVIPYLLGPPLVRTKFWAGAWPEVTHAFEAHLPPQANAFFMYATAQFAFFGFRPSGDFRIQGFMERQITELRTFRNDHTLESAGAVCVRQQLPGGGERAVCVLTVDSDYANGRGFATSNTTEIGAASHDLRHGEIRLPGVASAETLLRVHRMCAAEFEPAAPRVLPQPGSELASVRDTLIRQTERHADAGYFYLVKAARRYRLTWKGAVLLSWQQLWPVKQVRLRSAARRAEHLIARANALSGHLPMDLGALGTPPVPQVTSSQRRPKL